MAKCKCPKCKKTIEYLQNIYSCFHRVDCGIGNDKKTIEYYQETEKQWGADNNSWNCPECDAELFYNEKDAENFLLNGEK